MYLFIYYQTFTTLKESCDKSNFYNIDQRPFTVYMLYEEIRPCTQACYTILKLFFKSFRERTSEMGLDGMGIKFE